MKYWSARTDQSFAVCSRRPADTLATSTIRLSTRVGETSARVNLYRCTYTDDNRVASRIKSRNLLSIYFRQQIYMFMHMHVHCICECFAVKEMQCSKLIRYCLVWERVVSRSHSCRIEVQCAYMNLSTRIEIPICRDAWFSVEFLKIDIPVHVLDVHVLEKDFATKRNILCYSKIDWWG